MSEWEGQGGQGWRELRQKYNMNGRLSNQKTPAGIEIYFTLSMFRA
jgi:hypothetical protein